MGSYITISPSMIYYNLSNTKSRHQNHYQVSKFPDTFPPQLHGCGTPTHLEICDFIFILQGRQADRYLLGELLLSCAFFLISRLPSAISSSSLESTFVSSAHLSPNERLMSRDLLAATVRDESES